MNPNDKVQLEMDPETRAKLLNGSQGIGNILRQVIKSSNSLTFLNCFMVLKRRHKRKPSSRKSKSPLLSIFMYCSQPSCNANVKMTMQSSVQNHVDCLLFGTPTCTADDFLASQHQSAMNTRIAVEACLETGVGPTEAFEDVLNEVEDIFLTKSAVKSQALRKRKRDILPDCWPRDVMQCLLLLRKVQKDEITPELPVSGYIQDIGLSPVRLILHSAAQLRLYSNISKTGSLILHVDATAGIIRKAEYVRRQIYLLSAVVDSPFNDVEAFSVSDCLTEECRVEDAELWLRKLRCDVARLQSVRMDDEDSAPAVVVVDFSWVLLHSCLSVFCGTTVLSYLHAVFRSCMGHQQENAPTTKVFACTAHFISRAAKKNEPIFYK